MVIRIIGIVFASVAVGLVLLIANGLYLFNKFRVYLSDITSRSLLNIVRSVYEILPNKNKIFLLVQFLVLLTAAAGFIIYFLVQKKKPTPTKIFLEKSVKKSKSETDLDLLHRTLLSKKEIGLGDIERLFGISNEVAMEWCKILENAELAIIDYPTFKKPILRIPEQENKIEKKKYPEKAKKIVNPAFNNKEKENKIIDDKHRVSFSQKISKNVKVPETIVAPRPFVDKEKLNIMEDVPERNKKDAKYMPENELEKDNESEVPEKVDKEKSIPKKKTKIKVSEKTVLKKSDSKKSIKPKKKIKSGTSKKK